MGWKRAFSLFGFSFSWLLLTIWGKVILIPEFKKLSIQGRSLTVGYRGPSMACRALFRLAANPLLVREAPAINRAVAAVLTNPLFSVTPIDGLTLHNEVPRPSCGVQLRTRSHSDPKEPGPCGPVFARSGWCLSRIFTTQIIIIIIPNPRPQAFNPKPSTLFDLPNWMYSSLEVGPCIPYHCWSFQLNEV